jgi:hypothetical protein
MQIKSVNFRSSRLESIRYLYCLCIKRLGSERWREGEPREREETTCSLARGARAVGHGDGRRREHGCVVAAVLPVA